MRGTTVPEDDSVSTPFAHAMPSKRLPSFLRTSRCFVQSRPELLSEGSSHDHPPRHLCSELLVCLVRETAVSEETADLADRSLELPFPLEERLNRNSPFRVFRRALARAEPTAFLSVHNRGAK